MLIFETSRNNLCRFVSIFFQKPVHLSSIFGPRKQTCFTIIRVISKVLFQIRFTVRSGTEERPAWKHKNVAAKNRPKEKSSGRMHTKGQNRKVCSSLCYIASSPCHWRTSKLPQQGRVLSSRKIYFQTTLSSRSQLESSARKPFASSPANQTPRQELRATSLRDAGVNWSATSEPSDNFFNRTKVFQSFNRIACLSAACQGIGSWLDWKKPWSFQTSVFCHASCKFLGAKAIAKGPNSQRSKHQFLSVKMLKKKRKKPFLLAFGRFLSSHLLPPPLLSSISVSFPVFDSSTNPSVLPPPSQFKVSVGQSPSTTPTTSAAQPTSKSAIKTNSQPGTFLPAKKNWWSPPQSPGETTRTSQGKHYWREGATYRDSLRNVWKVTCGIWSQPWWPTRSTTERR